MKHAGGLHTDSDPIDQPEGTLSDALNVVGGRTPGSLESDKGTTPVWQIPSGYSYVGEIPISAGRKVVLVNSVSATRIYIHDGESSFTLAHTFPQTVVSHPMQGVSRVNNRSEDVLYWTDGVNPPRWVNLSRLLSEGAYYSSVQELSLFGTVQNLQLQATKSDVPGAGLPIGAWFVAVATIDRDGVQSDYGYPEGPIHLSSPSNLPDTDSGSAITVNLSGILPQTRQVSIAFLRYSGSVLVSSYSVLVDAPSSSLSYVHDGGRSTRPLAAEAVIIDRPKYASAKSLTQIDKVLYLGNLTEHPDIGYQKFANSISVELVELDVDPNADATEATSFLPGEVYALYISLILKDGRRSRAYHIPGRSAQNVSVERPYGLINVPAAPAVTVLTPSVGSFHVSAGTYSSELFELRVGAVSISRTLSGSQTSVADALAAELLATPGISAEWNVSHIGSGIIQLVRNSANGGPVDNDIPFVSESLYVTAYDSAGGLPDRNGSVGTITLSLSTGHSVTVSTINYGDSAATCATKLKTALDSLAPISTVIESGSQLKVTNILYPAPQILSVSLGSADYGPLAGTDFTSGTSTVSVSETADGSVMDKLFQELAIPGANGLAYWHNQNERYPQTTDFDVWTVSGGVSSAVGTLQDALVRHHRIPSLDQMSEDWYSPFKRYGFRLTSIPIPTNLEPEVVGYEVYFAKRDGANSLVTDMGYVYPNKDDGSESIDILPYQSDEDLSPLHYPRNTSTVSVKSPFSGAAKRLQARYVKSVADTDFVLQQTLAGSSAKAIIAQVLQDQSCLNRPAVPGFMIESSTFVPNNVKMQIRPNPSQSAVEFDTTDEESRVVLGLESNYTKPSIHWQNGAVYRYDSGTLCTFERIVSDVYEVFASQILVKALTVPSGVTQASAASGSPGIYSGDVFATHYTFFIRKDNGPLLPARYLFIRIPVYSPYCEGYRRVSNEKDQLWKQTEVLSDLLDMDVDADMYEEYEQAGLSLNELKFPSVFYRPSDPTVGKVTIIRSQADVFGVEGDSFRSFLDQDRVTLTSRFGEIVNLTEHEGKLVVHFERVLAFTRGREELQVADFRAFLGAGDILSAPLQQATTSAEGFAGLKTQTDQISTPFGYAFIDRSNAKMYLLSDKLNELSSPALGNRKLLRSILSAGGRIGFDPDLGRLFVSCSGQTLSYDIGRGVWESRHSFVPEHFLFDHTSMMSVSEGYIYRHTGPAGAYYTVDGYPVLVEFVENAPAGQKTLASVSFLTKEVVNATGEEVESIFDKLYVYNPSQASPEIALTKIESIGSGNVRLADGLYNVNGIRQDAELWQDRRRLSGMYHVVRLTKEAVPSANTFRILLMGAAQIPSAR